MRKKFLALLTGALVLVLSFGVGISIAADSPSSGRAKADDKRGIDDNLDGPRSRQQREDRVKGIEKVLKGKVKKGQKVVKVGKGRYVELAREKTDRVFVIIAEFGNTRHVSFPDTVDGKPASDALTYDGPLHNAIPKPDRKVDNSTLWQADYSSKHYDNMYFNRMAKYYQSQSSGRYSVEGSVTEWVKVPFNEARYGRDFCGGIVCNNTWFLIRDAMAYWVQAQIAEGKSVAQIGDYLKTFDKWDRYDIDGDGNFDEPDGFIDHFQIVHAGGDQAAGDPQQGTDAIWSHRWYAQVSGGGPGGLPGVNAGQGGTSSGVVIPNNPTGVWVGDYTIQPENGGLGVFAHEYGHDLGLPDLYDTSGNTGGAENSTGFWTLMSSGANIGDGGRDGIGDAPTDMGAWEKFQLGWLGSPSSPQGQWYDVVNAGAPASEHDLGPAEGATRNGKQALFVVLPDKEVPLELGTPCSGCGSRYFYSGAGNDYDASMTKTSGIAGTAFSAMTRYEAEEEFDFGFLEASTNGGTTWIPVGTNLSTDADQSGANASGTGITGSSGGDWVPLTATLPAGTNALRFRYETDPAVAESGFQLDQLAVNGTLVGTAETSNEGWVLDEFRTTTGSETQFFFNAYVVENRGYRGHDTSLKTAYNFGFLDSKPDWVESFPYQDGLLISYWDSSYTDNNVGDHPGSGLVLPVDAHPTFFHAADGSGALLRPRILSFDSTFSKQKTSAITININSKATKIPSQPGVDTFDDTHEWWFNNDGDGATGSHAGRYQPGWYGVKVPKSGTVISIKSGGGQSAKTKVVVAPK
jgi:immune inhibitor A